MTTRCRSTTARAGTSVPTSSSPWSSWRRCRSSRPSPSAARSRVGASCPPPRSVPSARPASCCWRPGGDCCSARASPCRPSGSSCSAVMAVGGCPTPGAYANFARGLVDGWADLLSSAPPADITQQLRALPFTVAWLSAAIGGEIARGSRRPGAAGDRADPGPRPEPAVHDRGALAGARAGRRHPRRHAAADQPPGSAWRPGASRRSTSSTPAAASASNRSRLMLGAVGRRRCRRRRPARRPAPARCRVQRALRPAPLPGATVRPAGRAQPARRGEGLAEGRPQGRRRVHRHRRHARSPASRSPC